jgi:hypothetical protein
MRRQSLLLDTSFGVPPFYTLRSLTWNVRELGLVWWLRCALSNLTYAMGRRAPQLFPEWHRRSESIGIDAAATFDVEGAAATLPQPASAHGAAGN